MANKKIFFSLAIIIILFTSLIIYNLNFYVNVHIFESFEKCADIHYLLTPTARCAKIYVVPIGGEVMKSNTKKILGAVICAVLIGLLWVAYALIFIVFMPELPLTARIAIGFAFAIPTMVLIGVTAQRIKEIRSGVEDDLSKY